MTEENKEYEYDSIKILLNSRYYCGKDIDRIYSVLEDDFDRLEILYRWEPADVGPDNIKLILEDMKTTVDSINVLLALIVLLKDKVNKIIKALGKRYNKNSHTKAVDLIFKHYNLTIDFDVLGRFKDCKEASAIIENGIKKREPKVEIPYAGTVYIYYIENIK